MSSLLLDGPISPELVLVAPSEEADEAREALPDIYEVYDWIRGLRELVEPVAADANADEDERGTLLFTLFVCLNAIAPLALVILWRSFA